jgi:hypothetical protein
MNYYASRGYEDRVVCTGGSPETGLPECLQVGSGANALSRCKFNNGAAINMSKVRHQDKSPSSGRET